uniref:Bone morphogenetic protein 3 n=1 Tax=Scleropages formosus TaxID=113540 RepID=A0A8C9VJ90_SCLFO
MGVIYEYWGVAGHPSAALLSVWSNTQLLSDRTQGHALVLGSSCWHVLETPRLQHSVIAWKKHSVQACTQPHRGSSCYTACVSTRMQVFNLTSITNSEDIISATLHFFMDGLQKDSTTCAKSTACGPVHLAIWTTSSADGSTGVPVRHMHVSMPSRSVHSQSWQWRDITTIVKQAKRHHEFLLGVQVPSQRGLRDRLRLDPAPYILVYTNDSDISGPERVASSLQRPHSPAVPALHRLGTRARNSAAAKRTRRALDALLPLQNNELPGNEYPQEKPRKSQRHRTQLLRFDERNTRPKQWREPRDCARRYLRVDFADIGWSEWIISPKSFDAYYCSGSCQFPIPKVRPSNHATIQSIVRAVGVVPGIPEPCCVPEAMSPLSILFFDQDKNVVLKVYPNMTVDSCVCR